MKNKIMLSCLLGGSLLLGTFDAFAYKINYHKDFWGSMGLRNKFSSVSTKITAHSDAAGQVHIDQVDVYCEKAGFDKCEATEIAPIKPDPGLGSYPALEIGFANSLVEKADLKIEEGVREGTLHDVLVIARPDGSLVTIGFSITWKVSGNGSADYTVTRFENTNEGNK